MQQFMAINEQRKLATSTLTTGDNEQRLFLFTKLSTLIPNLELEAFFHVSSKKQKLL